ncbi:MAG TPA: hypothetical protein VLA21_06525 [Candidatus Limnocylindria bacterium]|nr:hypothetical protein [Candidatus Limnocylindria bacterium]
MQDYIRTNKEAWEEAFDRRLPGWGDDNAKRLLSEKLPFFAPAVQEELEALSLQGKSVAQFCCNNGRELLSLVKIRRGRWDRVRHRGEYPGAGARHRAPGGHRELHICGRQPAGHPHVLPRQV